MHRRLGEYLVPSVHGCAHSGQVQLEDRAGVPQEPGGRRGRLRLSYERAGGRPDAIRRQPERWGPEGERSPRHCP